MPASKANTKLRIAVPLILLGAAVGLVVLTLGGGGGGQPTPTPTPTTPAPTSTPQPAQPGPEAPPGGDAPAPTADAPEAAGSPVPEAAPAAPVGLHAVPQPGVAAPTPIGSLDPDSGYELGIEPTLAGAGIESIRLTHHYVSLDRQEHFTVQEDAEFNGLGLPRREGDDEAVSIVPFSTHAVWINGARVELRGSSSAPLWRETAPGTFVAEVVDGEGAPVARVTKTYEVEPGSFDFRVAHALSNQSGRELEVAWEVNGPIDFAPPERQRYGGDMRRLRVATVRRGVIENTGQLIGTGGEIGRVVSAWKDNQQRRLYPDAERLGGAEGLAWVAQTSRYFATVMFADAPPGGGAAVLPFSQEVIERIYPTDKSLARLHLRMTTRAEAVPAGATLTTPFRVYAGPNSSKYLTPGASARYEAQGLTRLPVYSYGGMCAVCTFQWLARPLLAILRFFDSILGDWALAIMLLVVCVRTILHPITRKSQIGMLRFGKQMQAVQPKLKKLQEKYKGDPKRLQQEQVRLMREEGVNYAGMLGCLPMILQSPIWIALYAMLFFAVDLRHEPAFYGLFQAVSGGSWPFLADLSAPDTFIPLPRGAQVALPLLGLIEGINILPLLLGVVYYFQQKYLTPPRSASLTPEQEAQQKMIKVMMVVMFPLIIYNAPSGLAIYFITNSTLGIFESAWIRSHVNKDELEPEPKKKRTLQVQSAPAQGGNPFKKERERRRFKDR